MGRDGGEISPERKRILDLQAEKLELELQKIRGELVYAKDVRDNLMDIFTDIRNRILAIPFKCAHLLSETTSKNEISIILTNELEKALNELSRVNAVNAGTSNNKSL